MNKKIVSIVALLLLLVVMFGSVDSKKLKAQVTNLHFSGWAWSGYNIGGTTPGGLGWLSFDSANPTGTTTSSYKVNFNSSTGDISGNAWSSSYGWLSFDRAVTGNPPSDDIGAGVSGSAIAKRDGSNNIVGWARFISACKNDLWDGTKCTGVGAGNANGLAATSTGTSSVPTGPGSLIVATEMYGSAYVSKDGGETWNAAVGPGTGTWTDIAVSNDGSTIVLTKPFISAYGTAPGPIYVSSDGGTTWVDRSANAGTRSWRAAALSSDGQKIAAVAYNDLIYTSPDRGVTWIPRTSAGTSTWTGIASSDDGQKLVAVGPSSTYISTDGGANWITRAVGMSYVDSSADGSKLLGVVAFPGSAVYSSTDGGATWATRTLSMTSGSGWTGLSVSDDGTRQYLSDYGINTDYLRGSIDSGATWTSKTTAGSRAWSGIDSTNGGLTVVAAAGGNNIHMSTDGGTTWAGKQSSGSRAWNHIATNRGGTTGGTPTTTYENAYWDGWVSLNRKAADTVNYGLTYSSSTNAISGYAWGSPNNVGWIWFDPSGGGCTGGDCDPVIVTGNPIVSSCTVSPTSLALSTSTPSGTATWSATTPTGGAGPTYHYLWSGFGLNGASTQSPPAVTYTTAGTYSASVAISDKNYMATSTINCSQSLTVTGPGGGGGGTCSAPANATLCTGSDGTSGPVSLGEYGTCPGTAPTPAICQAECLDGYIIRGLQCVKKSTVTEQ